MHQRDEFSIVLEGHETGHRWRLTEIASFALAGLTLGAVMALAGHYISKNANARAVDDGQWASIITPATTISSKSAPLLPPSQLRALAMDDVSGEIALTPRVARAGKGDFLLKPVLRSARLESASITPATTGKEARQRIITSPPVWKLEESWRLGRGKRLQILSERKKRLAKKLAARKRFLREKACLTKALYFEARSESEKGQMAVAKIILNRVKDPKFPNTICGVVYQGAERRNSCQFSFACDGKSDIATQRKAWLRAQKVASRAMSGKLGMTALAGATYYHADYVHPRWAYAMRKVMKIGRHIFYRGG